MKKKFLTLSALVMALTLAAGCFMSCDKKEKEDDRIFIEEEEQGDNVDPMTTLELPEGLDLEGETFSMYFAMPTVKNSYIAEEENDNLLNNAVFKRNALVEQKLGVDLNFVSTTLTSAGPDQTTETNKISSLILAGDKTYDAFVHVQHTGMPGLINEGMFLNWNDIPVINLDKPWWYSNALRDITFGTKIFCMTGDYNLASFSNTECLAFNKSMLDELELDYPYQMVFDGTWTHDKFIEYIQAATKDLNGDGQMTYEADRYGLSGWSPEFLQALYVCYGGETLKKDDNNMPVLNIYSEQQARVVDKMIEIFKQPGAFNNNMEYAFEDKMFAEGRLLFNDTFLSGISVMRNYDDEIGFVPYPKIDEDQERYYSRTANVSGLTYLPITLDPSRYELVGATLETMAYYSNKEVLPVYFDTILTVQSTRDIESEQMIPIIKESARFVDQTMGFSAGNMALTGQNTLASHWMSQKTSYEEKLKVLIETYSDND